jgi:hypothetical protein
VHLVALIQRPQRSGCSTMEEFVPAVLLANGDFVPLVGLTRRPLSSSPSNVIPACSLVSCLPQYKAHFPATTLNFRS